MMTLCSENFVKQVGMADLTPEVRIGGDGPEDCECCRKNDEKCETESSPDTATWD
ncbi:MAG: hypothetical protein K6F64_03240 [Clostridia bacterium]|nr:hypothetical protein [Clostridia bacterium]